MKWPNKPEISERELLSILQWSVETLRERQARDKEYPRPVYVRRSGQRHYSVKALQRYYDNVKEWGSAEPIPDTADDSNVNEYRKRYKRQMRIVS